MDPRAFLEADLNDPAVQALCGKIRLEYFDETAKPGQAWVTRIRVRLKDGRAFEKTLLDVRGSPTLPMSEAEFDDKFRASTRDLGAEKSGRLLDGLKSLEAQPSVSALLALTAA